MEEKNCPLISVVMPVYNARQYIEKAIESVLRQSYEKWELILVDDGATDGSGDVCDRYAGQDYQFESSFFRKDERGLAIEW